MKTGKHGVRNRTFQDDTAPRRLAGVLSISRGGTGFVAPDAGGPDVIVPEGDVGPALPGDRVEVELRPPEGGRARLEGRVVRVLARAPGDFVCTLRRTGRRWTAFPLVPAGGRTFRIDDPKGAADGDRVLVRFSAWDDASPAPEAEVSGVIGPEENPSLDTLAIEKAWDLPGPFPPEVLEEARTVSARLAAPGPREDLRGERIITIDPATAKDFDDALSLTVDAAGNRVLGVHIADVSHFVRPGSALDAEARARGTSVYLVDHVLPMLPETLSNGVCSLVPGEDRLAFSAFLSFDAAGRMVGRRFARTTIRSARRLTYAEALSFLEGPSPDQAAMKPSDREVAELVRGLDALARQLRRSRLARFSLDISAPEPVVRLGPDGRIASIGPAERDAAHELVEEAMIAANEAVATELAYARIPHLCRFHDVPDPEKMDALEASLRALGIRTGPIRDAGALVRLLKAVRGTPLEYYVSATVLKSLKRAEYSADDEGHFGLAKRYYSHFTSPIRRYPDLVLHRQLAAWLAGRRGAQPTLDELRAVAREATRTEFRADQAERSLVEIKKFRFLEERLEAGIRDEWDGVVVKCLPFGAFVELPDLMLDGMVHVSTMSDAFVRFDRDRERLVAPGFEIGAGSRIRVAVTAVHFDERRVDLRVTDFHPAASGARDAAPEPKADAPVLLSSKDARHEARRARRVRKGKGQP